ncbi:MAG: hypothetical protein HY308_00675 [Gammaproteobacteria bacterium]|nr:hypothetical protein [Gammaproteobacteria bacterium]
MRRARYRIIIVLLPMTHSGMAARVGVALLLIVCARLATAGEYDDVLRDDGWRDSAAKQDQWLGKEPQIVNGAFDSVAIYRTHDGGSTLLSRGELGHWKQILTLSADHDLSERVQFKWGIRAEHDLNFAFHSNTDYPAEYESQHKSDFDVSEGAFVWRPSDRLDLAFGRQILNWTFGNYLSVLDVLNPHDYRIPQFVRSPADLRRATTMSTVNYHTADTRFSVAGIHEWRFDEYPAYGSDFYIAPGPRPTEVIPDDFSDTGVAAQLVLRGLGTDFLLMGAHYFDDTTYQQRVGGAIELLHNKVSMFGLGATRTSGDWIFITEFAYLQGLRYGTLDTEFSRFDSMFETEYGITRDIKLTAAARNYHINDYDERIGQLSPVSRRFEDEYQWLLGSSFTLLQSRLVLHVDYASFGPNGDGGGYTRTDASYEISDRFMLYGGLLNYRSGTYSNYNGIGDSDRFFVGVRYAISR